jgi:two-component system, NtrC family, nitrogen regulation sensor histidine kinase GlnL
MPSASIFSGLDLLSTAVFIVDSNLRIQYVNPAAESLLSTPAKSLLGVDCLRLLPARDELATKFAAACHDDQGFSEHDITIGYNGHGHARVAMTVSAIELQPPYRLMIECSPLDQRIKIDREEKIIERQQVNRELLRNLAHEIKNPLGGIRGAAQLLESELATRDHKEFTQVIIKEVDRLQSLMNRMLSPVRLPHPEPLNVHEVLEHVRSLLLVEFAAVVKPSATHPGRDGLAVVRDYDISLPLLTADREQLVQAVLNVARNAAQVMKGRGQITFGTRIARGVTLNRERYRMAIMIHISDNGPGVPEELKSRIFYPLVTGREGGTGLGLAIAQDLVSQHRGMIEFESMPGATRFTLLLPLLETGAHTSYIAAHGK